MEVVIEGLAMSAMLIDQMIQEMMRNCLSPLLKELLNTVILRPNEAAAGMDEKLRKQQIMELEVLAKWMELVNEQIRVPPRSGWN
ncbi:hypothetical protein IHE45_14G039700 [Dioscorea alata]|uniref:Uncharacterized protein n=1 Tax=Dioscorea alata TaxID=55571 RepID=A0ACB7UR89_DIOAL|nr:hypothetical protein IHE45_14G039700 [Dioscorea alata]